MSQAGESIFLAGAEANPQPGPYADPIATAQDDATVLHSSGCDDASIDYSIAAYALFNFYNPCVAGNGVNLVPVGAFDRLGERMAKVGYSREQPPAGRTA